MKDLLRPRKKETITDLDSQGSSPAAIKTTTDAEFVTAAISGSVTAFERLVERYHSSVYLTGYARLGNHEAAEDLAQEVFLRVFLHMREFDPSRSFGAWVSRIARNLAIDWLRRGQVASRLISMVPLEDLPEDKVADMRAQGVREKMETEERNHTVWNAVFALPPEQREMVMLLYAEELSQEEIAVRMEMHPSTVSRKIQIAMRKLRTSIDPLIADSAKAWCPPKQAITRTLAAVGAAAALSSQAKSALAAAGTVSTLAAKGKAGASSAAAASGLAGLLQSIWSGAVVTATAGAKTMMFGKGAVAIITGVALVGGGIYVVSTQPSKMQKQEMAASSAPNPGVSSSWENAFGKKYSLSPEETVKHVSPPFISERSSYCQKFISGQLISRNSFQNPEVLVLYYGNHPGFFDIYSLNLQLANQEMLKPAAISKASPYKLHNLIQNTGIRPYELEGSAQELAVTGDWVIRAGSSVEDQMRAIEQIIARQFGQKVRFTKQRVPREVVVVRGQAEIHTLPQRITDDWQKTAQATGWPQANESPAIHIYRDVRDPVNTTMPRQNLNNVLKTCLADILNTHVIFEIQPSQAIASVWSHLPEGTPKDLDRVLDNLSKQTSLSFRKEMRPVNVWFAELQ